MLHCSHNAVLESQYNCHIFLLFLLSSFHFFSHSTCFVVVDLFLFLLMIILLLLLSVCCYICLADHSTCFVGVNLLLFVLLTILLVLLSICCYFCHINFPNQSLSKNGNFKVTCNRHTFLFKHISQANSHSHLLPSSRNLNYMISSSTMTSRSIVSHSNRSYIISSKWVIVCNIKHHQNSHTQSRLTA